MVYMVNIPAKHQHVSIQLKASLCQCRSTGLLAWRQILMTQFNLKTGTSTGVRGHRYYRDMNQFTQLHCGDSPPTKGQSGGLHKVNQ